MASVDKQANAQQIAQAAFDIDSQSIKTVIAGEVGIALSASSGDSVQATTPEIREQKATVTETTVTDTKVIAIFDISLVDKIQLVSNTTATTTFTTPKFTLQLSPSATDDIWFDSSLTVTPSGTANTMVSGTALTGNLYKRARVNFSYVAFVSGSVDVYCLTK